MSILQDDEWEQERGLLCATFVSFLSAIVLESNQCDAQDRELYAW